MLHYKSDELAVATDACRIRQAKLDLERYQEVAPDAPRNKLYVDPLLPDWLPDITIRDLRLGPHKFDIRFWREGEQTEFEVLDGNANLVERSATSRRRL
jgi:hypothetical protein